MDGPSLSYLREFSLRELAEIDGGRIDAAFSLALARLADDVNDRPGDNRPRLLTMKIGLVPDPNEDGTIDAARLAVEINEKTPARQSKPFDMGLRRRNGQTKLMYSPAAVDNHRQPGLPMDTNEERDQ